MCKSGLENGLEPYQETSSLQHYIFSAGTMSLGFTFEGTHIRGSAVQVVRIHIPLCWSGKHATLFHCLFQSNQVTYCITCSKAFARPLFWLYCNTYRGMLIMPCICHDGESQSYDVSVTIMFFCHRHINHHILYVLRNLLLKCEIRNMHLLDHFYRQL